MEQPVEAMKSPPRAHAVMDLHQATGGRKAHAVIPEEVSRGPRQPVSSAKSKVTDDIQKYSRLKCKGSTSETQSEREQPEDPIAPV